MSASPTHFRCEHCGKQYAWKESLAGKRAKCACGQTITVPEAQHEPEPSADDLYDFAEPDPQPKPVTTVPPAAALPVGTPGGAGNPAVLNYTTRPSPQQEAARFDNFYHPPRDFYWPCAVLAVGFIALLTWAVTVGASGTGLVVFTAYITVATVIKTAVMIGAAFVIAPMAGISFGTFWTAVLKLAAIVVMTDAALFWLEEIMVATGAYPAPGSSRRFRTGVGLINTLLAATLIAIMSKVFFDMDREEVGYIAVPLAILNRVLNLIILLILAGIVSALTSAAAPPPPPPAPTAPAPAGAPAVPAPVPANPAVAAKDQQLAAMIKSDPMVRPATEYYERSITARREHVRLVEQVQYAGAPRVYVRLGKRRRLEPLELIVEMPAAPAARSAVVTLLGEFASEPVTDQGDRFLVISMPSSK